MCARSTIYIATEVFEQNTILKNDRAGGLINNLRAEFFGGCRQVCSDEAETYEQFLQTLNDRGLLQHFRPGGKISMRPPLSQDWAKTGHIAAKLISKRTGGVFVVDGWYEKGGEAVHILQEDDWRKLPIRSSRNTYFGDVVSLVSASSNERLCQSLLNSSN